jgi:hypothetical protein
MFKSVTGALAAVALCAAVHAFPMMGAGTSTCEKFLADIGKNYPDGGTGQQMEDFYFSWAQGWMSQLGRKREIKKERLAELNPPGFGYRQQQAYLKTVCTAEPKIRYRDAVDRLYIRLLNWQPPAA